MDSLLVLYVINILGLVPIGLGTLFNFYSPSHGGFPESAGWRTLVGSLWTAILVLSCMGLVQPLVFSPVLLLQVIYKTAWLLVYVGPRVLDPDRRGQVPPTLAGAFLIIVIVYPFFMPWRYLLGWA